MYWKRYYYNPHRYDTIICTYQPGSNFLAEEQQKLNQFNSKLLIAAVLLVLRNQWTSFRRNNDKLIDVMVIPK